MLEPFFFGLGIVNSIILILVFWARKDHLTALRRYGWVYLLLAIPAIYTIVLAFQENKPVQYPIFLAIFLIFLSMELFCDFILKVDFRVDLKRYWKLSVPYLALYWAMNYGFIVMVWKTSPAGGLVMLGLFIVQIVTNVVTHPKGKSHSTNNQ
jgi:hypothetical protein